MKKRDGDKKDKKSEYKHRKKEKEKKEIKRYIYIYIFRKNTLAICTIKLENVFSRKLNRTLWNKKNNLLYVASLVRETTLYPS